MAVDNFNLCVKQRVHFEEGVIADILGEHQPIAIEAAVVLEEDIEAIGRSFMDEESLARARDGVERFAYDHPAKGPFARQANLPSKARDDAYLDWIITTPLKVFKPFSGLSSGVVAIQEFTAVADEFKSLVATMPEEFSWRTE